ncbi:gfo/Idh/MocA family oxidoreductase [Bacillus sp. HMF5848]|uniref:Gfo/Idh/MocA family protein n=1 Tax=Bacillus sp. HMF5848 TaxID=2495421 RepID=UPI000F7A1ED8|nr:Gfo/Idh/MocA family oxidoreductase [Bacillus sp. HMF5848]RSK27246.1 gfo/Idh/MocA family oxidoreductase [Bacillus sp. HMF5848]
MKKAAVIGLGAIGERFISNMKELTQIKIIGVCDTNRSKAEMIASTIFECKAYDNYELLLSQETVDFVYVAVPPKFHFDIVIAAIEKGIHILCEKPLANSIEEALLIRDKANKAGIVHAMNFPLNYSAGAYTFFTKIKNGEIGKLRRLELCMQFPQWPRPWQQNEWVASREQGGFILEVGVHFIQQTLKIFGNATLIHKELELPEDPKRSEIGIYALLHLNDTQVPFVISGLSDIAGEERIAYTAYGTDGTLSLINWRDLQAAKIGEAMQEVRELEEPKTNLLDEFISAIDGKQADIYDFNVGYDAQQMLDQLRG